MRRPGRIELRDDAKLEVQAARFEGIGWSVAAKVWGETANFVREWAARVVH